MMTIEIHIIQLIVMLSCCVYTVVNLIRSLWKDLKEY